MSILDSSPLSPELIGIWSSKVQSRYEKKLLRFFWFSTCFILILVFIETINQLGLVPVTTFLILSSIILFLDYYSSKYPCITIPASQVTIFIGAAYIQFYNLFSQQPGFLDNPNFPILPDLLGLALGIMISIRIPLGIELIKINRQYQNARIPLSDYARLSLSTFEINLRLASDEVKKEFQEEEPSFRSSHLLTNILFSICIMLFLLIPSWLNVLLNVIIYPYILLIPTVLILLISLLLFSPKAKKEGTE